MSIEKFCKQNGKSTPITTKYYQKKQRKCVMRYVNNRGNIKLVEKWETYHENGKHELKKE